MPWVEEAFVCSHCGQESVHPMPFCGHCGTRKTVDWKSNSKEVRPGIRDLEEIRSVLDTLKGNIIRLWDYSVSHCELQFRFAYHSKGVEEERFNTILMCADTDRVECGTYGWNSALTLTSFEGKYSTRYLLKDEKANVCVDAGLVVIYQLMDAKLFA